MTKRDIEKDLALPEQRRKKSAKNDTQHAQNAETHNTQQSTMVKASAAAVHSSLQQGRRTGRSKSFPILTKIILVVAVFAIVRTINVWVFPDDPVDGIVTTSSSNGINWEQMAKSSNKQSNEFTSVESTQSEEPRQVRHDGTYQ